MNLNDNHKKLLLLTVLALVLAIGIDPDTAMALDLTGDELKGSIPDKMWRWIWETFQRLADHL